MCDYSITATKTRDAEVGDKLTVAYFGSSKGFAPVTDCGLDGTAVCLRPGTELAFDKPVAYCDYTRHLPDNPHVHSEHRTAIFRQVNKDNKHTHHDTLEFPDGSAATLSLLDQGQTASVLQLPAKPKTKVEAEEQTRAEFVG